jgi:hypothetical protein
MQAILVDDRLDLGQIGDLMDDGYGIITLELVAAPAARGRLAVAGGAELLGTDQGSERFGMARLSAALASGRRSRRLALQADRVRGRGFGGIGGVELELSLEVGNPPLQLSDPFLEGSDDHQDGRLGFRRYGVPEGFRNRRLRSHQK